MTQRSKSNSFRPLSPPEPKGAGTGLFPRTALGVWIPAIVVAIIAVAWGVSGARRAMGPDEDAATLLRYAANLAGGHGIVWNPGGAPVDGASEFLFMLLTAAITRLGAEPETAARIIAVTAHTLCVVLLFVGSRKWLRVPSGAAFLSAVFLALGPAIVYVGMCYGPTLTALLATCAWLFANRASVSLDRWTPRLALGASLALLGIARPEGVFLGVLIIAAQLPRLPKGRRLSFVAAVAAIPVIVAAAYLAWRAAYFVEPLPLSVYKKTRGPYLSSLVDSVRQAATLGFPFVFILLLGLIDAQRRRAVLPAILCTLGFVAIWMSGSSAQNLFGRFQYPVLPIILLSWPAAIDWQRWGHLPSSAPRRLAVAFTIVLVCFVYSDTVRGLRAIASGYGYFGTYQVGHILAHFADDGYTIATTEPGIIPYYSRWRTLDTWGLNDPRIARGSGLTTERLKEFDPDIIMFNVNMPGMNGFGKSESATDAAWIDMAWCMFDYAEANDYVPLAIFAQDQYLPGGDFYYIKRTCPLVKPLRKQIGKLDYGYWGHLWPNVLRAFPNDARHYVPPRITPN